MRKAEEKIAETKAISPITMLSMLSLNSFQNFYGRTTFYIVVVR